MENLREVIVTMQGSNTPIRGFFHRWYKKVYEDGTTMLFAVVERESDGVIEKFMEETHIIRFPKDIRLTGGIVEKYAK